MRVTFYSTVVLVAAGGVVMGLDWMSAPMPPMPAPKNVVFVPPPPPPPPKTVAPVAAPAAAPSAAASPSPTATPAPTPSPGAAQSASAAPVASVAAPPPAPLAAAPAAPPVRIRCDADACAAAYRSFRESDCTYNPSFGPRRLCTKGDRQKFITIAPKPADEAAPVPAAGEPVAAAPEGTIAAPEPAKPAAAPPRCNVSACAAAYRSFRESDCTYNPSYGPRRLCEK